MSFSHHLFIFAANLSRTLPVTGKYGSSSFLFIVVKNMGSFNFNIMNRDFLLKV